MTNLMNALTQGVPLTLLLPATLTSTTSGTGVDVSLYEGFAAAVVHSAAGTGTTPTMNVKLEHCATVGGTYADISGATFVEIDDTAGGSVQIITFDARAVDGFVRATATLAGTSPSFVCSCNFIGMKKAA